eukprot:scaffold3065_cov389-Prasinococcus_capsulatus_cf.AAC.19
MSRFFGRRLMPCLSHGPLLLPQDEGGAPGGSMLLMVVGALLRARSRVSGSSSPTGLWPFLA